MIHSVASDTTERCARKKNERRFDDVPVLRMMKEPVERVRARAVSWRDALAKSGIEARVVDVDGAIGGGALVAALRVALG